MNIIDKTIKKRWIYPVAGVVIMLCIGNVYAWSVFVKPLQTIGWSVEQTTRPFQLSIIIFAISMLFAGKIQDKAGPGKVALFSGIMMGLGFILMKFIGNTEAGMIISFSLIAGTGMGAGYVTPLATALKWYPEKKGLISGVVVMGMGAGSIFGGVGGPVLIEKYGLWNTFLIFGILFGLTIITAAFFLRNPSEKEREIINRNLNIKNKDTNDMPAFKRKNFSSAEMVKTRSFYSLWIIYLIGTGGGLMIISQTAPFGVNIVGLSPVLAGSVITILGIFNGLGRPFFGFLSDKIGRKNVIYTALIFQIISLFLIMPHVNSYFTYALAISLIGFSYGGFLGTMPSITADFYGEKNLGSNYAWVYTGWGAAGYFGPELFKRIVGTSINRADWNLVFYSIAGACIIALLVWFFTKNPEKN